MYGTERHCCLWKPVDRLWRYRSTRQSEPKLHARRAEADADQERPAGERRLIGGDATALDIPAKVNGEARYGIDAAVDGMIYAGPKITADAL